MFEVFYERYRAVVFRTAFGLTGDREFAEEVLQDTFVRAYRHRANLLGDRSPLPWLKSSRAQPLLFGPWAATRFGALDGRRDQRGPA